MPDSSWMAEGLCVKVDLHADIFFPPSSKEDLTAPESRYYEVAKMVCDQCPVRSQCATAGYEEDYGVWGGTTPKERRNGIVKPPAKMLPVEHLNRIPSNRANTRLDVPALLLGLKQYTQRRPPGA